MNSQPEQFHVTASCRGVILGTAISLTPSAFVTHLLSIHDKAAPVDLTVYPYDAGHRHMRRQNGRLYPLFIYRCGCESLLSHAQLKKMLEVYADGMCEGKP
jgi:hypothetical protein